MRRRPQRRKRPGWPRLGTIAVTLTAGAGGVVLLGVLELASARSDLARAAAELGAARGALVGEGELAVESLDRATARLLSVQRSADGFPLAFLRPVPLVGSPVDALHAVSEAGIHAVGAGRDLVAARSAIPLAGQGGVSDGELTPILQELPAARNLIEGAQNQLELAQAQLAGPAGAALPMVSEPASELRDRIDATLVELDRVDAALALVAEVTSSGAEERLLVVAQDTLELRPAGGYIGSYGVLVIRAGQVHLESYQATEDLAPPEPPLEPPPGLAGSLPGEWGLSNSNWWPDFPTSARAAGELFARQGGGTVSGVVAVTEHAMARLIEALGPLRVDGYPEPVTGTGFSDRVLYEIEQKHPPDEPRKRFLIELSKVLFAHLFNLEADQVQDVVRALDDSIAVGDIQMWFSDPRRQESLHGTVVAGELVETHGDLLCVVDSNLSASKANGHVAREISYLVEREGDHLVGTVRVDVSNDAPASRTDPYYHGYLRVWLPTGAEPLSPPAGQLDGYGPGGRLRFLSQRYIVGPGDTRSLTFTYRLPSEVVSDGRYRLNWYRQVGTSTDELRATMGDTTIVADPAERVVGLEADLGSLSRRSSAKGRSAIPPKPLGGSAW